MWGCITTLYDKLRLRFVVLRLVIRNCFGRDKFVYFGKFDYYFSEVGYEDIFVKFYITQELYAWPGPIIEGAITGLITRFMAVQA